LITIISILQKVLINRFYKEHAGFFIFFFFVFFGIPNSVVGFHLSLIEGMIHSRIFLLLVCGAWLLYNMKCAQYISKCLREEEQQFLYVMNHLPVITCWWYFLLVQLIVYLPVLSYAIVVSTIAVQHHQYVSAFYATAFNIVLLFITPLYYLRLIQRKPVISIRNIGIKKLRLPKPLLSIPLFFLLHERKQMLFITKLCSVLFLSLFFRFYTADPPDIRALQLCCMLCTTVHSAVIFQVHQFMEERLGFTRALPITLIRRFVDMLILFALLLLPELLFLWKGYPLQFTLGGYMQVLFMMLSLSCLFYSILLTDAITMPRFIRVVFGILAGLFFVVLYNPGILLPFIIMLIAAGFYFSYYHTYEQTSTSSLPRPSK